MYDVLKMPCNSDWYIPVMLNVVVFYPLITAMISIWKNFKDNLAYLNFESSSIYYEMS